MSPIEQCLSGLRVTPKRWLITGVGGFIGSHLLENLLAAGQAVVGLDNFTTGKRPNLELVLGSQPATASVRFQLLNGDIRSLETCRAACRNIDVILHEAAQVSVPASVSDPLATHEINTTGFLNLLRAAEENGVRRLVYASSCALYGDSPNLPLREEEAARPLSLYASSKLANEAYAAAFAHNTPLEAFGLRYFNVFGPRQDPQGVYAAVIPLWISAMMEHAPVKIFGDGENTRDFCHIANIVQANLLAATTPLPGTRHDVVNVAVGHRTSLNELFEMIRQELVPEFPHLVAFRPRYEAFRAGDIRHSHATIAKAQRVLGYQPTHGVAEGLKETVQWFRRPVGYRSVIPTVSGPPGSPS